MATSSLAPVSSTGKWMALTAALLGWMFDGMEMGLFPLVARPALKELLNKAEREKAAESHAEALKTDSQATQPEVRATTDREVDRWYGIVTAGFLIGAATGGVLFGWLGDRLGRVRAMTLSVLTYTLITGVCAFASSAWQILALRFIAALGMGGEWSLGVALINEIWPGRSRAFLAGFIGAAANVGFFLSGASSKMLRGIHGESDDVRAFLEFLGLDADIRNLLLANGSWRLMMLVGAAPALLCFFLRLFVPESQRWEQERRRGATSHWATRDLLGVLLGSAAACGIIFLWAVKEEDLALIWRVAGTVLGFAVALAGFLYPVMRYLARAGASESALEHGTWPTTRRMLIGAALSGVALIVTWGAVQPVSMYAAKMVEVELAGSSLAKAEIDRLTTAARETTQMWSAIGAILFSILAALLSDWIGRRLSYLLICLLSLASVLFCYQIQDSYGTGFLVSVFLMGGLCSTFYGWLPLYLPELFRTAVRATGQGFCYNFGRILAAIVVLQIGNLYKLVESAPGRGDNQATVWTVFGLAYLIGMGIIWLAPETKGRPLPE